MQTQIITIFVTVLCVTFLQVSSAPADKTSSISVEVKAKNNDSVNDTKTEQQNNTNENTKISEKGTRTGTHETKVKTTVVKTNKVEVKKTSPKPVSKSVMNSVSKTSTVKKSNTNTSIVTSGTRQIPKEKTQQQTSKVKTTVTNTGANNGAIAKTVSKSAVANTRPVVTKEVKVKTSSTKQIAQESKQSSAAKSSVTTASQTKQMANPSKQVSIRQSNVNTVTQTKQITQPIKSTVGKGNVEMTSQTKQITTVRKQSPVQRNQKTVVSQTQQAVTVKQQPPVQRSQNTVVSQTKQISKVRQPSSSVDGNSDKTASQVRQIAEKSIQFSNDRSNVDAPIPTTTPEIPVTDPTESVTTYDGRKCISHYRPHPSDPTMFEFAHDEDMFENMYQKCPALLVWRQEICMCDWPLPDPVLKADNKEEACKCCSQGVKKHDSDINMYQRLVNGEWVDERCSAYDNSLIWNNANCTCVWNPEKPRSHKAHSRRIQVNSPMETSCLSLVNMTLDDGLKDANGRVIRPNTGRNRIKPVDKAGNIGRSLEMNLAPFTLKNLQANDLQKYVYFKFNFKVHEHKVRQRRKMVILSNGCVGWQRQKIKPSLEVSFFPKNETFVILFTTKGRYNQGKSVIKYVQGSKDENGWYKCVLYLQDAILNFKVNGRKVFSTNGMSGGVKSTDCGLTVAGKFHGYLDELQVVKQCKYEKDEKDGIL